MKRSTKSRLTEKQIENFQGDTLFDKIARAVCRAGTLPGKELFEAWEMARRVRRKLRGGRVVDMAGGHGLLAHIMLLLDGTSTGAVVVDKNIPKNAYNLSESIINEWPNLKGRIQYVELSIEEFEIYSDDLVISVHACGSLTDKVIAGAVKVRARVAVLPCCHDIEISDTGGLEGWLDGSLAVDVVRAGNLRSKGYNVLTRIIPEDITPKNRIIMGYP
ncbi:MAG: SAM-dependent methyltransferase [Desulfobacterales bacterium]|nr:SAM-dependent methyltransferase [Desulfobacterales bacterium]